MSVTVAATSLEKVKVTPVEVTEERRTHVYAPSAYTYDAGQSVADEIVEVALSPLILMLSLTGSRPGVPYEEHPPSYLRRLGGSVRLVLPGFTMTTHPDSPSRPEDPAKGKDWIEQDEWRRRHPERYDQYRKDWSAWKMRQREKLVAMSRTREEVVTTKAPGQSRSEIRESPATGVSVTLVPSCDPSRPLTARTGKGGIAHFDLTRGLSRTCVGRDVTITVKARYAALTAETSRTLKAEELGVTWTQPRFRPEAPPLLEVAAAFTDPNSNGLLDAAEPGEIALTVASKGKGDACLLTVKGTFDGTATMVTMEPKGQTTVETLAVGVKHVFRFGLTAEEEVPDQSLTARFTFDEINGFAPDPVVVKLRTRPYDPPQLVMAKWEMDDDSLGTSIGNGDRVLQRGELAEITAFVQNRGTGPAEDVTFAAKADSAQVFVSVDSAELGTIAAGKWQKALIKVMINNRYRGGREIPIRLAIAERRPKFNIQPTIDVPCQVPIGERRDPETFQPDWFGGSWDGPKPRPVAPPLLVAKAILRDPNGTGVLDANETAEIRLTVANQGRGQAHLVAVRAIPPNDVRGVTFKPNGPTSMKLLAADQEHTFRFTVAAEQEVAAQNLKVQLVLHELNGFEPDPITIGFMTRPYDRPHLVIAKWDLDDDSLGQSMGNGDGRLEPGEQAEITLFVENRGEGEAKRVTVSSPEKPHPDLTVQIRQGELGEVKPGQTKKVVLTLMVNRIYKGGKEIPIQIRLDEQRAACRGDATVTVPLGERAGSGKAIVVASKQESRKVELTPLPEHTRRNRADEAQPPTETLPWTARTYAVLIGISRYQKGIPELEYAAKDAHDVRDVLLSQGVPTDHIKVLTDEEATLIAIQVALGNWLSRAKDATVIVHWSGHGFEDPNNFEEGYFACYDTPSDLPGAGYRMKRLTDRIKASGARNALVVLDTCHAGHAAYRGPGGISGGAADGFIRFMHQQRAIPPGVVVIAAGDADRRSLESGEWQNGMLTHVVLAALRGRADGYLNATPRDGTVTLGELKTYVATELPKVTTDLGQRACHPVIATLKGGEIQNRLPLAQVRAD